MNDNVIHLSSNPRGAGEDRAREERLLRRALRLRDPGPGFGAEVTARIDRLGERRNPRPAPWTLAATLAVCAVGLMAAVTTMGERPAPEREGRPQVALSTPEQPWSMTPVPDGTACDHWAPTPVAGNLCLAFSHDLL
jgi:hypothetical protein